MNKLARVLLLSLSLSWANSAAGLNSDLGSDTSDGITGEITLSSKQVAALRGCFDGFSSGSEQTQEQAQAQTKAACYEQTLLPLLAASGSHSAKESNQLTAQVQPNVNTPQLPAATSKRLIKEQVQEQVKEQVQKPEAQMGQKYLRDTTKQVNQRIAVNLTKAKKDVHQRWMYYFDNGQVWQQQEARYMSRIKQFPVSAVIEQSILGSHNLTFDGSSKVFKVRRIQ